MVILSALLALPAMVGGQVPFVDRLVVLHPTTSEVTLVDPLSRTVVARIPTGPGPQEVVMSPDGRFAYIANYGTLGIGPADESGGNPWSAEGSITVLDVSTGTVHATLRLGPYHRLHGIQVSRNGRRLWLTAEADSGVLEVDAQTGDVLMLWKTGGAFSHTLASSADGRDLFVANRQSRSVTVIDRLTVVVRRIPTGQLPEGIDLSPGGRQLWVGNRGDHTLTVIDARKLLPLATFSSGGLDPVRLRFRPDGREVWVSNRGSHELAIFDAQSRELLDRIPLPVEPRALVFSPDGRQLYVSAPASGQLILVDVGQRRVTDSFYVGPAPDGLTWSRLAPATAARAVSNQGSEAASRP